MKSGKIFRKKNTHEEQIRKIEEKKIKLENTSRKWRKNKMDIRTSSIDHSEQTKQRIKKLWKAAILKE